MRILSETNPRITFSDAEIFVNHEANARSGHLGHAMAELPDGTLIAFYSNCSAKHGNWPGHTMYGWVEYRRSHDRGVTWSEPTVLKYSWDCFIEGVYKIGCEKAVVCDDGTIVLFCLRSIGKDFEPYATPVCLLSRDGGGTWSEPIEVHSERGRIYDALYRNGRVYVLEFCNSTDKGFTCNEEGLFYKLIVSDDNGQSFRVLSALPFDTMGHAYGSLLFRPDGSLIFYGYNVNDEYHLTCLVSEDGGVTWSEPFLSHVAKIARNPQTAYIDGVYILHGRSEGSSNFVMYHSADGIHWSDGMLVDDAGKQGCFYSNNMVVKGADGKNRLLVQYSDSYAGAATNITHAWVEIQ